MAHEKGLQDENIDLCMLGEGEVTLTDLISRMINNKNRLPLYNELKQIQGIAFLQKTIRKTPEKIIENVSIAQNIN